MSQKSPSGKQPGTEEPVLAPAGTKEGSPKSSNQLSAVADPARLEAPTISQQNQPEAPKESFASRSKPPILPGKRGLRSLAAKISRLVGEGRSSGSLKTENAQPIKLTERVPLSVEMPLNPAISARFDVDEIEILRKIYRELNVRSVDDGIDKETFIQYFHLPGLWSERLFLMFDRKKSGHVDYEDLMRGLAICCRGTKSERVKVLFDIVDVNGDEKVSKEELTLLLSNLPNVESYVRTKYPLSSAAVSRTNSKGSLKASPVGQGALSSTELRSNGHSLEADRTSIEKHDVSDEPAVRHHTQPPPETPERFFGLLESPYIDERHVRERMADGDILSEQVHQSQKQRGSLSAERNQNNRHEPLTADGTGEDESYPNGNVRRDSCSSNSSLDSHASPGFWFRNTSMNAQGPERYCSTTSWRSSVSGNSCPENADEDQYLIGAGPSPMVAELLAKAGVENENDNLTDVEALVTSIIETYDAAASDALNFDDFKSFVEHHPRFLKLLSDCAREEVWSLQGHVLSRLPKQNKLCSRSTHNRFRTIPNFGFSGSHINPEEAQIDDSGDTQVTEMLRMEKWIKIQTLFTSQAAPRQLSNNATGTAKSFTDDTAGSGSALNSTNSIAVKTVSPRDKSHQTEDDSPPQPSTSTGGISNGKSLGVYPRHAKYAASREVIEFLETSLGQVASDDEESDAGLVNSAVNKVTAAVDTVVNDRESLWQDKADALSCPNCLAPLLVCPKCDRRFPSLRMKSDNELTVECHKCLDGQQCEYSACWICQWPFQNAIEMIEKHQATLEGPLWKMGKKSKEWVRRHFVLVDKLLYYYLTPEDTIPKGFIFLEGCFVDSVSVENKTTNNSEKETQERSRSRDDSKSAPSPIVSDSNPASTGINTNSDAPATTPRYGFCVFHAGATYGRRELYAEDEQTRDKWVAALRGTLSQQAIDQLYTLKEIIGHGKFSKVFRATEKTTGKDYAVKMISKVRMTPQEKELLRGEMSILRLLRHPHVIYLKSLVTTREVLHIVMEYVPGGELFDMISRLGHLPELVVNRLTGQLLRTLVYLHKAGIVHRDLKPENVLLSSKNLEEADIKIADFGLSCLCGPNENLYQPCGTLVYVAPEVLTLQGYNHQVDLWSLGVMIYLLLCGKLPFPIVRNSGLSLLTNKEKIYQPKFDAPVWKGISKSAQDFVCKLLQVDPNKRMTDSEALNHIWIKNPAAVLEGPGVTPIASGKIV